MKKEIDAEYMIKSLGLEKKPKLNLYVVIRSNLALLWWGWTTVWGVIGLIVGCIKLWNYCV